MTVSAGNFKEAHVNQLGTYNKYCFRSQIVQITAVYQIGDGKWQMLPLF